MNPAQKNTHIHSFPCTTTWASISGCASGIEPCPQNTSTHHSCILNTWVSAEEWIVVYQVCTLPANWICLFPCTITMATFSAGKFVLMWPYVVHRTLKSRLTKYQVWTLPPKLTHSPCLHLVTCLTQSGCASGMNHASKNNWLTPILVWICIWCTCNQTTFSLKCNQIKNNNSSCLFCLCNCLCVCV